MNDSFEDDRPLDEEEDFASLLDAYDQKMNEEIGIGDKIRGEIIEIGMDSVFINTGTKIDGVVEKTELLDEDGRFPYQKGDALDLYVVRASESEIRLSRSLSGESGNEMIFDAHQNRIPVDGKVREVCKGGFRVEIMKKIAFCPLSQMDLKYIEKPEPFVGNTYQFLITRVEEGGRNIVVSRRDYLEIELKEARSQFVNELAVDKIIKGQVVKLMDFGAFVELFPGIEGMIHISELSWSRIEHPKEIVSVGETVTVTIIGLEETESRQKLKIGLSLRQAAGDPWDTIGQKLSAGDMIKGKVTRCLDFGAFVEIEPGIEGLVHVSEMSYTRRVHKPQDLVQPGDIVPVMIKEINQETKRISLSMKDAEGDPWVDVPEKYPVGRTVKGTVERKESFGLFILLEPGVTGLMHKSQISQSMEASRLDKLKPGEAVTVQIDGVNTGERRISLIPSDLSDSDDWRSYSAKKSTRPTGSLGEKLQQALMAKKKNLLNKK